MAVAILISAVVSLTLHPHAVRAPAAPHARGKPWPPVPGRPGRFFDRIDRTTTAEALNWVLGTPAWLTMGGVHRHAGAHGACCTWWYPRASSRCRTRARCRPSTEGATSRSSFSPPWPSASRQLAERILRDPAVKSVSSFIGVDGANTTLNTGRLLIDLQPHGNERRRFEGRGHRGAPPGRRHGRAVHRHHACMPAAGAGPDHRRPRGAHAVPVAGVVAADSAQLQARPPRDLLEPHARPCRNWPTWPATCKSQGLQAFVQIDRAAGQPPGGDGVGHRQRRCTTPSASASSPPSSRSPTSTAWCWRWPLQFKIGPEVAEQHLRHLQRRRKPVALSTVARVEERATWPWA